jgi:CspA family cold shock protein
METGTVKWFSPAEGYGFVEPDNGEDDVFLHHSEVPNEDLEEGDRLEFEIEETEKGLNAINIQPITEEPGW